MPADLALLLLLPFTLALLGEVCVAAAVLLSLGWARLTRRQTRLERS